LIVMAGDYTPAERMVLIAGMTVGRDSVWSSLPSAVERLADRGLVEVSRQERADGTVESIPLGLSDYGIREARSLDQS
jgi:hypothetical protein